MPVYRAQLYAEAHFVRRTMAVHPVIEPCGRWCAGCGRDAIATRARRLPPSFVAGQQLEPGFGDVPTLSTRQQRFTHVRLTSAHLTGLLPPFATTLTTSAIEPTQLAVVWTLILQSEPEGPTLISCAARLPGVDRYMTPSSRRRGAPLPAYRGRGRTAPAAAAGHRRPRAAGRRHRARHGRRSDRAPVGRRSGGRTWDRSGRPPAPSGTQRCATGAGRRSAS